MTPNFTKHIIGNDLDYVPETPGVLKHDPNFTVDTPYDRSISVTRALYSRVNKNDNSISRNS